MSNTTIDYYAGYSGGLRELRAFTFEYFSAYLSDFTFEENGITYNIRLGKKGDCSNLYRFTHEGKSYISDNLWFGKPDKAKNLKRIWKDDIKKSDIWLNNLSFLDNDAAINVKKYFISMIEEERISTNKFRKEQDAFWSGKKVVFHLYSDCGTYLMYIVEKGHSDNPSYAVYISSESILANMHNI